MSMKAKDVDACEACRKDDHGKCPDPEGCGCEFKFITVHSDEAIESLRTQLAIAVHGREDDREQFRKGVEAWQKKIKAAEDLAEQLQVQLAGCSTASLGHAVDQNGCKKGDYGWSVAFEDVKSLWKKYVEAEKRVTAAQALKKKILKPNNSLVFDADAVRAFLSGLPKEKPSED